jgi:4-hydroxybenzoate polyprenyltransferase
MNTIRNLITVSRAIKILPVLLLPLTGYALFSPEQLCPLLSVLSAMILAMLVATQLNVVADADQDAAKRPHLQKAARELGLVFHAAVLAETVLSLLLITYLFTVGEHVSAAAVSIVLFFGVVYSFFPYVGGLKRYWFAHAGLFVGGYFSAVVAGAFVSEVDGILVQVALVTAFADYAIYLGEAAIDIHEDRQRGLRLVWVVLGQRGSALVGLGVLFFCALVTSWQQPNVVASLGSSLVLRALFLVGCMSRFGDRFRLDVADPVFFLSRVTTIIVGCLMR